jgi:hypothetical protein
MAYNRFWIGANQKLAWTIGGGTLHNPGRYLALLPPVNGILTQNPGDELDGWDISTGLQYMPNEYLTFGIEFVSRHTNIPYFSGHGGVTSPNGWNSPIGDPEGYKPDLVKDENRIIASILFKI